MKIDLRRKSVLIVECDTPRLKTQSLSVGSNIFHILKLLFNRNPIELVETDTEGSLLNSLARLASDKRKFQNIILIGHSNRQGFQIGSDKFINWDSVANWFCYFKPIRIFLIACNAGRWLPCASLFAKILGLKEIYGSPIQTNVNQSYLIAFIMVYMLNAKKIDHSLLSKAQIANFALTKGVIIKRSRKEFEKDGISDGVVWTAVENLLWFLLNHRHR
jgi:hypothetical protein